MACNVCRVDRPGALMVECDACQLWFHDGCVGLGSKRELNSVNGFHCADCVETHGPSTYKVQPQRRSQRNTERVNYKHIDEGVVSTAQRFQKILAEREFAQESFKRVRGGEFTLDYIRGNGWSEPVMVDRPDGLGMRMPSSSFSVSDVVSIVGGERKVSVIQVSSQTELPDWNMFRWEYYFNHPRTRPEILNVISLEFSDTPLAQMVDRPRIVDELDWAVHAWPKEGEDAPRKPKVQLYCLMSVGGAFTDFHIDFAGSSVYYHVLSGMKKFYFIRPTRENLRVYERWSSEADQSANFLADLVERNECVVCTILPDQTLFIPSGWIHAVYTPEDSVVIGGNFLHSFAIPTQLDIDGIELRTNVPAKFRYPSINRLHWYLLQYFVNTLEPCVPKRPTPPPPRPPPQQQQQQQQPQTVFPPSLPFPPPKAVQQPKYFLDPSKSFLPPFAYVGQIQPPIPPNSVPSNGLRHENASLVESAAVRLQHPHFIPQMYPQFPLLNKQGPPILSAPPSPWASVGTSPQQLARQVAPWLAPPLSSSWTVQKPQQAPSVKPTTSTTFIAPRTPTTPTPVPRAAAFIAPKPPPTLPTPAAAPLVIPAALSSDAELQGFIIMHNHLKAQLLNDTKHVMDMPFSLKQAEDLVATSAHLVDALLAYKPSLRPIDEKPLVPPSKKRKSHPKLPVHENNHNNKSAAAAAAAISDV